MTFPFFLTENSIWSFQEQAKVKIIYERRFDSLNKSAKSGQAESQQWKHMIVTSIAFLPSAFLISTFGRYFSSVLKIKCI
jgi:hypothetical protein